MTIKNTILQEALTISHREGLNWVTESDILKRLDIAQATYRELFSGPDDMVKQIILFDIERQKKENTELLADSPNAVHDIMRLLQNGIASMKKVNPLLYMQLQSYPEVWAICLEHLNTYSYHQTYDIINKGILEGLFRRDINIKLVTKIILEQINLLLNPAVFPPEQYDLSEVFRCIYLYYIRGLCTDAGSKQAEGFFSTNSF